MNQPRSIPRPLVRTNQWSIVIFVVLTWVTGQYWLLAVPFVAGLCGLLFRFNPIMRIGKLFLQKDPSTYTPEDWEQQQFNQKIAVLCLAIGILGYWMHWMVLAYVFTVLVALAAFIAILGFCIGCWIRFKWLMYRSKKASAK